MTLPEQAVQAADELRSIANKFINEGSRDYTQEFCASLKGIGFRILDATSTLQAAAPYLSVGVKELEWGELRKTEDFSFAQDAETCIGRFIATDNGWFIKGLTGWFGADDIEAAKAAAQADFEQRIRSCLTPSTNPTPEVTPSKERELCCKGLTPEECADVPSRHCSGLPSTNPTPSGFRQGIEAAAEWHESEISKLNAQIASNNDYRTKTGSTDTQANDYCRDLINNHRLSAAAIRSLTPAPVERETDDDTCTCCHGTGWYESMERYCDCEDGLAARGACSGLGLETAARFHESEAEYYEAHAGDKDGIPFPIVAGWHRLNAQRIRALAPTAPTDGGRE